MSNKITLPSGATVLMRDPDSIKVKDRKKIMLAADKPNDGDLAKAMAMTEALIAALIEEWSFDLIIPSVKIASLEELSLADYDALSAAAQDYQKALFPNFSGGEDNPDSPKDNSND